MSVIVVVYNMPREAPRTLYSLSADYQRHLHADQYEVIVVDNGSYPPFDPKVLEGLAGNFRLIRMGDASPSPGTAINRGLAEARGDIIGVMVDGARIATPGLLHFARHAARLYDKALVATLNWHLGSDFQGWAIQSGYDQYREDALLKSIDWEKNGYRLFEIGLPDESSVDGWFQPLAESNALFLRRQVWAELGGVDERFDAPGGGLINLDTFCRALALPAAELVILLSEATFHQVHGGMSSNAPPDLQLENWVRWSSQYASIHGRPYELKRAKRPPSYLGTLPRAALARMVRAAIYPSPMHPEKALGENFNTHLWTDTTPSKPSDPTVANLVELADNEFLQERFTSACAVARLIRQRAPDEPEPQRLLSLVAPWLRPEGPQPLGRHDYHLALAQAHSILAEKELAAEHYRSAFAFQLPYSGPYIQYYLGEQGSMHLPFLYEVMRELKPRVLVHLGFGKGEAYFTFCQSAADHRLVTECYGFESPEGDAGPLDSAIPAEVATHNLRYSTFSTLKTMTFMEASEDFADESIELLHFGSIRCYDEIKRYFEAWQPKLSRQGVILFQGVLPRQYASGIWKLWNEIARPGASFEFNFGNGLGLWRKRGFSERDPALLRRLFGADALETKRINDHQAVAASALALWSTGVDEDTEIAAPLQISLFSDGEGDSDKGLAMTKVLAGEGRQIIRFEHIESLGPKCSPRLRIAHDRPAFVTIFSIKLVCERNGVVLYKAESAADFERIEISDRTLAQYEEETLLLIAIGADSQMILPALDLPASESCYLEMVLASSFARFPKKKAPLDGGAVSQEGNLRLDVFHPVEEGYRQTECQSRYFAKGSWEFLTVDLPARNEESAVPIRIDPVTLPAVIEIAEIILKRPGTGETVWAADTQKEFDQFAIGGTASRLPHPKHLRILSFGSDPQLLLPSFTIEMNDEPLRLELSLCVDPSPNTIKACLATLPRNGPSGEAVAEVDVDVPHLGLSVQTGDKPSDGFSLSAPIRIDEIQMVRFENIECLSQGEPGRRLRISPLYAPAFLKISRVVITRNSDSLVLYSADSADEFEKIEVSEGASKRVFDERFTVTAGDRDQHIYLPLVDLPLNESCRLELEIEPYSSPVASLDSSFAETPHPGVGHHDEAELVATK